ncbi:MAG TPA: glutathione S-transferase family protein [Polyangiales bacterium]|jgi:glutathione S-transferase|nr:glutathione S-transferase family protein [Polyangiales bacterium]
MPRKLFLNPRSPFARKVRIVLLEKKLSFELAMEDLQNRSAEFKAVSPLGKIPLLIDEDGTRVFDSTVIVEYLEDRYPDPPMLGRGYAERLRHRAIEELADTIGDQTVAIFFADGAPIAKAERLLGLALDELCTRIRDGVVPSDFGVAHAAAFGAIGYHEFRCGQKYLAGRPEIARFLEPHFTRESVRSTSIPQQ